MMKVLPILLLVAVGVYCLTPSVFAAWQRDSEVTEVGRNAERTRQLLFWLFTHSSLDDSGGARQIWSISRNIVYLLFIVVLVAVGFGLMFWRDRGFDITRWIPKIVAALVFVTFSYLFILGFVQVSDILTRFFIERVGGCNLFNINFSGEGSKCIFPDDPNYTTLVKDMEENYTKFFGYRFYDENDAAMPSNESANTSLVLIRITTFTYNVMAFMLILRKVILWLLIILSPFLGILMLFIVIKNTGWLWIGVFFQWLFYGPMMALFLSGLVRIWEVGIPYGFDWVRRDAIQSGSEPWVFSTAINILVGGPAQTLSTLNSVNFVDTYAEYVIALIMLWTVILLPWLLLRCFREYCCHTVNRTLKSFGPAFWGTYDEIKKWKPPSAGPEGVGVSPAALAKVDLPYRQPVAVPKFVSEKEVAEIVRQQTSEIVKALGLAVPTIQDVALADINMQRRQMLDQRLQALRTPAVLASENERRKFTALRHELRTRAARGDITAGKLLAAAEGRREAMVTPIVQAGARPLTARERLGFVGQQVREKNLPIVIPMAGTDNQKLESVEKQLKEKGIPLVIPTTARVGREGVAPGAKPGVLPTAIPGALPLVVSIEDYEEVKKMWANHYRLAEVPISDEIKNREEWLKHDITKITNTIDLLAAAMPEMKKKGFEQVSEILPFLLLGGFTEQETISYLKAKLEAAKVVLEELEKMEKAKEEAKVEEEELVEVPVEKKKEEEEALEAARKLAEEIPEEVEKVEKKEGKTAETGEKGVSPSKLDSGEKG